MSPQTKKILVVEDEGLIAMDLKRRLERSGYSIAAVAATAEQARRLAASLLPDLILMDIRLEGEKDGIETAKDLRRLDIPVVFVTAHADDETMERAKAAEPYGYIVKPFGTADLRAQIEMALSKHQRDRNLRRSEAWLSDALHSVGDALIATDSDGNVELMNAEAERLTGWRLEDARGMPCARVFRAIPAAGEGENTACDHTLLAQDSTKPALIETVPADDCSGGRLGKVIAFRDVTARREMEEMARQSRTMETAGVMAGAVEHDFNNLLMIILGHADAIQADPRRRCDEAREIQRAAKLAATLSRRMVNGSDPNDESESSVFDLNRTIRNAAKMLTQVLRESGCELILNLIAEPLPVFADRVDIQRVLVNLTMNARDAMPQGGRFEIAVAKAGSAFIELTASDSGMGMDDETRKKIFEPRFSRKGTRGRGLGMTIVHNIVMQAGGAIEVESEPGCGTRFRILIPAARAESAAG